MRPPAALAASAPPTGPVPSAVGPTVTSVSRRSFTRRASEPPAFVLVAGGAVSVQFGSAVATHLFPRVGPIGAVTLRLVLAAVALTLVSRGRSPRVLRSASRHDRYVVVAFGLVLAGMNLAFYEALDRIPLGVAVTVEFAGPLAVTIGASRRLTDLLWAALAAGGVFLLAGGGLFERHAPLDLVGIGLALAAGACWAGYILLNAQTGRRYPGTSGLAIAMAVGAICVLPGGLVEEGSRLVQPVTLALGLSVALLSSALPYSFELAALRRVSARAFGVLMSMEPGIAALAGLLVLGQHLSLIEVGALLLVVAANIGSTVLDSRAPGLPDSTVSQ